MEQLGEIARAHYQAASPEVQKFAYKFFKSMDTDEDGKVDLPEFLNFMKQQGCGQMKNPHFFKELDKDGNGTLDFWEVMTLYYIFKSGRPFCDMCGEFIPGVFFSCVECFKGNPESSFNLCLRCYKSDDLKRKHNHNGQTQFLDNYTLLQAIRNSALGQTTMPMNAQATSSSRSIIPRAQATSSSTSIIPRAQATSLSTLIILRAQATSSSTTSIRVSRAQATSSSTAIVPASRENRMNHALRALNLAIAVGNIAATLCTIM